MADALNPQPQFVVKLQGGIGNQLFQYGFGAFLAFETKCSVAYLTDAFDTDTYGHSSVIGRLFPEAKQIRLSDLALPACRMLAETALQDVISPAALLSLVQSQGASTCILDGYWQDTRYANPQVLAALAAGLKGQSLASTSPVFAELSQQIANASMPVAMHVRRHDYKHHGVCFETYYIDSLRWIASQFPNAQVFVFSDEPNYTGHFLRAAGIPHRMVISGDDVLDLWLMTQCKMHVISNSSYSWWGSRLSQSQLTLYPLPWSQIGTVSKALFPPQWHPVQDAVSHGLHQISFTDQLTVLAAPQ
jgi:hypothetical protein